MFATRAAAPTFRAARVQAMRQSRAYSAVPHAGGPAPKKDSNMPLALMLAGVAGLGAFAWMNQTQKKQKVQAPAVPGINAEEWTTLTLKNVEPYNDNTRIYHFGFDGENAENKTSGMTVASCIMIKSPEGVVVDSKGKPIIRPYTPVSSPDHRGEIELMIKEYPTGKLTPWLSSLKPGEQAMFKGPFMKFEYKPNAVDKALFVSGGSGVTPAYQLISHAMNEKTDKTKFTFLFANVSEKDILLRKEWDALAAAHPDRLKVVYFLDKAPEGWNGEEGYISKEKIQQYFPKKEGEKVQVYVCGPPGQYAAVSGPKKGREQGPVAGALGDLGYTSEEVFKF